MFDRDDTLLPGNILVSRSRLDGIQPHAVCRLLEQSTRGLPGIGGDAAVVAKGAPRFIWRRTRRTQGPGRVNRKRGPPQARPMASFEGALFDQCDSMGGNIRVAGRDLSGLSGQSAVIPISLQGVIAELCVRSQCRIGRHSVKCRSPPIPGLRPATRGPSRVTRPHATHLQQHHVGQRSPPGGSHGRLSTEAPA